MPSQPQLPRMPRVLLVRHGETEWSLSGQHASLSLSDHLGDRGRAKYPDAPILYVLSLLQTGRSDIPLTENGEAVLARLGKEIVGDGKVLDPRCLSKIIKSPRKRTQRTFDLLFQDYKGERDVKSIPTQTTEHVREWDYGKYEGITSNDIHKEAPGWNIFDDGCPEGESVEEISQRVDKVIAEIRQIHTEFWKRVQKGECQAGTQGGDVLIVTHGHFSKCFLARWCELPLKTGKHFVVDAGGLSVGSYDHRDLREPALQALNLYSL